MVKGISRQVIVVHAPEPKMFEQAIFILKDDAVNGEGVTETALLQEAKKLISGPSRKRSKRPGIPGPVWAFAGALATGMVWMLCALL